jgi:hypothetical protein
MTEEEEEEIEGKKNRSMVLPNVINIQKESC